MSRNDKSEKENNDKHKKFKMEKNNKYFKCCRQLINQMNNEYSKNHRIRCR